MSEENKSFVRHFVDQVQSRHDLDVIDELVSPDFSDHGGMPPGFMPTRDGVKQFHGMLFTAFPDLRAVIHDMVAEGDKVVTHKTFQGTHKGNFLGIPPSGNQVRFAVIDILRIVDGKITDHWAVVDRLGLLQQIGAIPTPDQSG